MLDARGQSCPIPVIMVQKEIKANHPDTLEVLVDNACSVENVTRFAGNNGYSVKAEKAGTDFKLVLTKD